MAASQFKSKENYNSMKGDDWVSRWAGSYTFISCTYWGPQYFHTLKRILGVGLENTLFIHHRGTVSFFVRRDELDALGKYLTGKVRKDEKFAHDLLEKLTKNTDTLMGIMGRMEGRVPTAHEYEEFMESFERHLAYHVFMKKTVDYMDEEMFRKLSGTFKDARLYSEPVYSRTESFFRSMAEAIGRKEGVSHELLTCLTKEELEEYIKCGALPKEGLLKERYEGSVLLCEKGVTRILTGKMALKLENGMAEDEEGDVRGTSVHPGFVRGTCRIVKDPKAEVDFENGDILVTGMTRPEFIKFYDKTSAIVTDVGGRFCHAAMVALEMGIPCVVGTGNATRKLKDGKMIEVDATKGIVRNLD